MPRGPTLRGPRTWMRHRHENPPLPGPVEELDRYYTGVQNPIGRSAGTGKFRSNSERVVLAISQPPETTWRDEQAGPVPAKARQGSLLILKVSSGSVQNWRRVKESGASSRLPSRDSDNSPGSSSSRAQHQRRPIDMPTRAAGGPAAAHLIMPKDPDESKMSITSAGEGGQHTPVGHSPNRTDSASRKRESTISLNNSPQDSGSLSQANSMPHLSPGAAEDHAHLEGHTAYSTRSNSRGVLSSCLGATTASRRTGITKCICNICNI